MLITRVELQDAKSYLDDAVTFTQGTNAICGENGAGKSTLLEAIGFTLFDYSPYKTQADFIREGKKKATIAVRFVSNQDGREYEVERNCGSSSDYFVYDPEIKVRVATGKADVLDWLREHLGVEPNTDLTALFRDAVGVPQGLLTAPFLQRPSERKPVFDRLLRVDEYEQVWKTLRETLRHLEDKITESEKAIARLETQVQRLPGLRERAESLRAEVARIETRLADLRIELDEVTARRETLEATKKKLDDLTQKARTLTTRLEGVGEQLATAEKEVTEAEAAQAVVEASQPGHDGYQAARAALSELEEGRQRRDKLRDSRTSQEKSLALVRAQVTNLEANLSEVEEAEAQMAALRPQVGRQEELETALETAREQVRSLEMAQVQATERQERLDDLQARLTAVESGLTEAGQVEAELRQAQARLKEARETLTTLTSQQAALAAEVERLGEQTHTLETAAEYPEGEAADCPVCEQPLTPAHRADLLARNRARLDDLTVRDEALAAEITATTEASSALEGRIQNLDVQLRDLPRPADKADLVAQITNLESERAAIHAEIEELADSGGEAARLERELADLGDPRRQYERLAEKASQRADLEERLAGERHAAGTLEASLAEIEEALAPLTDLNERLAEQRAARDRHEADHRRYLENVKVAADLPARREQTEALRTQQTELSAERDVTQAQVEEVTARFDPDAFAAARQREADLRAERAGLESQLDMLCQGLSEAEDEIKSLEATERTLVAERSALADYQELLTLAQFIRQVIRDAGPHVTRRLMQQVSLEAARLFADVMADHTARLRWQEGYDIVLEKDGRDRGFQQLSGGEQMAAALAVRLALLRELSSIDVAFFDEPTANLDDVRRDSLAEQILSVKGFSQLFVISHDDTFERVTDNVVRVRKENGVSKISGE